MLWYDFFMDVVQTPYAHGIAGDFALAHGAFAEAHLCHHDAQPQSVVAVHYSNVDTEYQSLANL